jgi:hypothetical protein
MVACLGQGEEKVALGAESDRLLEVLRNTIIGMVRREGRDLSARQFAVMMLISDLEGRPHTVRELALRLNVPKPSITRGIDRLVRRLCGSFSLSSQRLGPALWATAQPRGTSISRAP